MDGVHVAVLVDLLGFAALGLGWKHDWVMGGVKRWGQ